MTQQLKGMRYAKGPHEAIHELCHLLFTYYNPE